MAAAEDRARDRVTAGRAQTGAERGGDAPKPIRPTPKKTSATPTANSTAFAPRRANMKTPEASLKASA